MSGWSADLALVQQVLAGNAQASEQLFRRARDTVWTACCITSRGDAEARAAFLESTRRLSEDNFRQFRAYNGKSRLETFVALITRELLEERIRRLVHEDKDRGWEAFVYFFNADIERIIRQALPGLEHEETRLDVYQDVCAAMVKDDFRRLEMHGADGSFGGFICSVVRNLVSDQIRRIAGRRREPKWKSDLERHIYRLTHVEGREPYVDALEPLLQQAGIAASEIEIKAALLRVREAVEGGRRPDSSLGETIAVEPPPEDELIERERQRRYAGQRAAVLEIVPLLETREQHYLQLTFDSVDLLKSQEIADRMGLPVQEVYALRPRLIKKIQKLVDEKHPGVRLTELKMEPAYGD